MSQRHIITYVGTYVPSILRGPYGYPRILGYSQETCAVRYKLPTDLRTYLLAVVPDPGTDIITT